jgi:hypothetical protein
MATIEPTPVLEVLADAGGTIICAAITTDQRASGDVPAVRLVARDGHTHARIPAPEGFHELRTAADFERLRASYVLPPGGEGLEQRNERS